MTCTREVENTKDPFAVAMVCRSTVVGNVPQRLSAACALFLARKGTAQCKVTGIRCFIVDFCIYHSVPHICLPFCKISASRKCRGGAYIMRDLTFYLTNTPPLPGPRLDVYRPLQKLALHRSAFASLVLQKPNGQDRLTEVGHSIDSGVLQALCGFVLSTCYSTDTTRGHACKCR